MRRYNLCLMFVLAGGCATSYQIPARNLESLDGYRADERSTLERIASAPRTARHFVTDDSGERHAFDDGTTLVIVHDGEETRGRYRVVDVAAGRLRASPAGPGRTLDLDLTAVQTAEIERFSWGKTTLLTAGVVACVLAGIVTVGLVFGTDGRPHDTSTTVPCGHGCELTIPD